MAMALSSFSMHKYEKSKLLSMDSKGFHLSRSKTDFSNVFLFKNFLYYYLVQAAFRALAGKGYQTLQSLLLDFCQCHSSESLLDALLDMLVDGKFDVKTSPIIKVMCQHIGLASKSCLIHLCTVSFSITRN